MVTQQVSFLTLYLPEPLIIAPYLGETGLPAVTASECEDLVSAKS